MTLIRNRGIPHGWLEAFLTRGIKAFLVGAFLALVGAGPASLQAQVHIEQVETVSSQLEDVTQEQVVLNVAEGNVGRGEVLGLLPMHARSVSVSESRTQAVIYQEGNSNEAEVNQRGPQHLAVVVHQGSHNRTTLSQQGASNTAGVRLQGSENDSMIRQDGTGNEYMLDFNGHGIGSAAPHTVEQIGDQNTLIQTGVGGRPFNVQQRGNELQMVIRHNRPQ